MLSILIHFAIMPIISELSINNCIIVAYGRLKSFCFVAVQVCFLFIQMSQFRQLQDQIQLLLIKVSAILIMTAGLWLK